MKLVLDTNVYIAAFFKKSLASDVLLLGKDRKLHLYVSSKILEELKEKLAVKFNVDEVRIQEFLNLVDQGTYKVAVRKMLNIIEVDPDDDKILECAVAAEADLMVSMDRHILKLKKYGKIGIVHPKTLTWIIPQLLASKI